MTPQEYDNQIAQLRAKISSATSQIAYNDGTIAQHRSNQAKDNNCKGKVGQKKTDCQATNAWRNDEINRLTSSNAQLRKDISSMETEVNNLVRDREAAAKTANEVSKELATLGLTQSALLEKAKGENEAVLESARITANATAEAIKQTADSDSKNKQKMTMLYIGIGVVVLVVVGVVLWKKYKK